MHRDLRITFEKIYDSGFVVPPINDDATGTEDIDPEYPSNHPLVTPSHPPEETREDLKRLHTVGVLKLEEIDGEEMYVLTEYGFKIAHDREVHNRQIELEKRETQRQRELNKGVGFVSFALVCVTTISIVYQDMEEWAADWLISGIVVLTFLFVIFAGGFLLQKFYRADNAGWDHI